MKRYLFLFIMSLLIFGCKKADSVNTTIQTVQVDDYSFNETVLTANQLVVVDFWASWCGPCRNMDPVIEELANTYKNEVLIAKIDIDENALTTYQYGVNSLPAILFFKNGEVIDSQIGLTTRQTIVNKIERHK